MGISEDNLLNINEEDNLKELLQKEKEIYIKTEMFIRRNIKTKIRSLPLKPSEVEVRSHLNACRKYYKKYKTTEGELSPFINSYNKRYLH